MTFTERFAADRASARRARAFVGSILDAEGLSPSEIDAITLVTSELATNAVVHAGTAFTVTVEVGEVVQLSVFDGSPDEPAPRRPDPLGTNGRGLGIVEALTTSWNVDHHVDGKTVRCRFPVRALPR